MSRPVPPWSILDPDAEKRYVPSHRTDIRKTFARIRREQADIAKAKAEQDQRERDRVRILRPIPERKERKA